MKLKELHCSTEKKEVKKVIILGPPREIDKISEGIKKVKKDVLIEPICTTTGSNQKLPKEKIYPKLEKKLSKSDEKTLIITDIGDTRQYKGEEIAIDSKRISNAAFVLLTSNPNCISSPDVFYNFVSERGFDPSLVSKSIDYIFHYTGDEKIFNTIISNHESRLNYLYDKNRLILVFEVKPNYYSGYLTKLYEIKQDCAHFLLARDYQEAREFALNGKNRFAGAILGLKNISESLNILKILRAYNSTLPVIFESSSEEKLSKVRSEKNVFIINKKDPLLLKKITDILTDYFGFGDFIFRTKEGEIKAKNLEELYELIKTIDGETLLYHASRNEFSNWLYLHGFSEVADTIKPIYTDEAELLRELLLHDLEPFVKKSQKK
jgi:hypothetical protein